METIEPDGAGSALELGYVFARELEYRSGLGDYSPQTCASGQRKRASLENNAPRFLMPAYRQRPIPAAVPR
jgi:hypothetical protein